MAIAWNSTDDFEQGVGLCLRDKRFRTGMNSTHAYSKVIVLSRNVRVDSRSSVWNKGGLEGTIVLHE